MAHKNNWLAKIIRAFTAFLPIANNRSGKCLNCGACCKLPNLCPFLKFKNDGKTFCSIRFFRSLSCRKYPRTRSECLTKDTCGFKFE